MSMTDPVADFLTRIRNAIQAGKDQLVIPRSSLKLRIAEILKEEGYIDSVMSVEGKFQGTIEIALRYDNGNAPAITGLKRVSRPGQRAYSGTKRISKVRNGLGIAIISTSKGVMTDRTARKLGVGGEVLCEVW